MAKHIRCSKCRFVRPDETANEGSWTAYECGNKKSPYYKALLNVSIDGDKYTRISWQGCELGERGERQ